MKKRADNFSYDIILEPVVTEKSTNLSSLNKVVFKVAPFATKANIKKSIEKQYNKSILANFNSIDKSKFVVIIDDFHKCKLKEKYRSDFAFQINENFDKIIYTSQSSLYFNSIKKDKEYFNIG